jgi:hypothetical protein
MRSIPAAVQTALATTPHTLCWLGKFEFANGTIVRVSTSMMPIVFNDGGGDQTFAVDKGFKGAPIMARSDGSVPDTEVLAPTTISDTYDQEDVFAGIFEGMEITLWIVDYSIPEEGGINMGTYTVSEIDYDDRGKIARFEVRGITQRATQIEIEELSVTCRSNLGDPNPGMCNLPLYPDDVARSTAYAVGDYVRVPDSGDYHNRMFECTTAGTTSGSPVSYDYTVANTTTDGTAVFTAREAWVKAGEVVATSDDTDFTATITESRAVDDWFANGGFVHWVTGDNAGLTNTVRKFTASGTRIQLWDSPYYAVVAGDEFEIMPGCNKTLEMCRDRFANSINFRGEKDLPGVDFLKGA